MNGWVRVFGSKRWHYFRPWEGLARSLCGKQLIFSSPRNTDQLDNSPGNCRRCLEIKRLDNKATRK